MRRQMGVESEDSTQTAQARTFAVSRDCGSNEWIQKTFTAETRRLWCARVCFLPVMWLTQFAEELHSQRSVDEEEQHEEESKISHLQSECMIDYYYILQHDTTCL